MSTNSGSFPPFAHGPENGIIHFYDPLSSMDFFDDDDIVESDTKVFAFYLPQFHEIPENNKWWGHGFTEWTNTRKARPNFYGHFQPLEPTELGYYDLSDPETIRRQVAFAKQSGVSGFAIYHYWFDRDRLLEKPVELFLDSDIEFEFCVVWANENWTRNWDGGNREVLKSQEYRAGWERRFVEDLIPIVSDSRYLRVSGLPFIPIYRVMEFPEPIESVERIREAARLIGLGEVHLAGIDFYDIEDPRPFGLDSLVEFPPHKFNQFEQVSSEPPDPFNKSKFRGAVLDYQKIIQKSISRPKPEFNLWRSVIPGWDNTARRQHDPTTVVNDTPEMFRTWLRFIRAQQAIDSWSNSSGEDSIVFVNAWNEWAEGAIIEPSNRWGTQISEAISESAVFRRKGTLLLSKIPEARVSRKNIAIVGSKFATFISSRTRRVPALHKALRRLYEQLRKW